VALSTNAQSKTNITEVTVMFKKLLEKRHVLYAESFATWEEAVTAAAQPLLRDGAIKPEYIDHMISSIKEYGPYIVIAPNIAMPHAQGDIGVNETSFSFLKLNKPVHFSDSSEHDAQLIFVLASVDSASHLGLLEGFVEAVSDEKFVDELLKTQSIAELEQLVAKQ
jgi:PTS system ascorbate-specific IIA component